MHCRNQGGTCSVSRAVHSNGQPVVKHGTRASCSSKGQALARSCVVPTRSAHWHTRRGSSGCAQYVGCPGCAHASAVHEGVGHSKQTMHTGHAVGESQAISRFAAKLSQLQHCKHTVRQLHRKSGDTVQHTTHALPQTINPSQAVQQCLVMCTLLSRHHSHVARELRAVQNDRSSVGVRAIAKKHTYTSVHTIKQAARAMVEGGI
jgi:hypothetical protein